MKLSALSIFIAAAGLVAASPLRVIVVSHQEITTGPHGPVAAVIRPATPLYEAGFVTPAHRDCGSLRNKALSFSNSLRAKFGLPPIKPNYIEISALNATVPTGQPSGMRMHPPPPPPEDAVEWRNPIRIMPVGYDHDDHQRMMWRHHRGSFMKRVHHALMTLGPWEGRAVAFVLGCGIGVLLRMIWVMTVVTARLITGRRSGEDEIEAELVSETDAEEILVPPPQYTDEKAELVEADKKTAAA